MGFKVTTSRKFKNLTKATGLTDAVKKEFGKRGPLKVKQAIVQDMIKGISPVKGGGKWKKYSNSYKETIRGKATFRKINGKTIKMDGPDKEFMSKSSPTKSVSPVNLRHSGGMHKSLSLFFKRTALVVQFKNFLADIHNRRGAGKSKVIRRLLPTKKGEQFNRRINTVLFDQLKKAVDKVAKQFSGQ